ncbi:RNA-directed DNA polymerase, eukaryota [Tanacetum coccineum]
MACSVPYSDDEIQALVQKQIDEDMVRQKAILDLALQFDNACTTKKDLRQAYEKCNDIPQEIRALIDTFLKEGSDKDYELNLSMVVMSTQEYMKKVVKDVGEDEDFKSGRHQEFSEQWKLDQVVAIVKSCSPNVIGDLTVTMKDLSGTILGTIHHKFIGEGGCGKDITIGVVLILANVSVFSPKPSMHYLNITMRNVVKVFRKDTVPGSSSG